MRFDSKARHTLHGFSVNGLTRIRRPTNNGIDEESTLTACGDRPILRRDFDSRPWMVEWREKMGNMERCETVWTLLESVSSRNGLSARRLARETDVRTLCHDTRDS